MSYIRYKNNNLFMENVSVRGQASKFNTPFYLYSENNIIENYKSFSNIFRSFFILALIIILCDIALKLAIISRHYQINDNCRLLTVEKSSSNFEKLSSLSKLKSKQKIWEFCREFVK